MPTPRSEFAIAIYESKVYCIGGVTQGRTPSGVTEVYNPTSDSWSNATAMPTPRRGIVACTIKSKIYVVGSGSNETDVYDTTSGSWTKAAVIPFTPISGWTCTSAAIDDKMYVIGAFPQTNSVQVYDPSNNTWSLGQPVVGGYYFAAAGATAGVNAPKRIYVLGLDENYWFFDYPKATSQSFDFSTGQWTVCPPIPSGRFNVAIAVLDDRVYAIGGGTPQINGGEDSSALVEVYTPVGFSSNPVTTTPQPIATPTPTPLAGSQQAQVPVVVAVAALVAVGIGAGLAVFVWKRGDFRRKK